MLVKIRIVRNLFTSLIALVVLSNFGCSSVPSQDKSSNQSTPPVQNQPPSATSLCKDSQERESLEVKNVSPSIQILHGKRLAVVDPPDEGYPYECGLQYFIDIHWRVNDLILQETVIANEAYPSGRLRDHSSDAFFYDAKMAGSELVVAVQLGYNEAKTLYRFKLDRKLKKIIKLAPDY